MPKKYSHAFTIAFELETDHDAEHVTAAELLIGLGRRYYDLLKDFLDTGSQEVVEACGPPFDTCESFHPDEIRR